MVSGACSAHRTSERRCGEGGLTEDQSLSILRLLRLMRASFIMEPALDAGEPQNWREDVWFCGPRTEVGASVQISDFPASAGISGLEACIGLRGAGALFDGVM